MSISTSVASAVAVAAIALVSCSSNPATGESGMELTGAVFSLNCAHGWENCYSEARRRCGNRGFDELDRGGLESVAIANQQNRSQHAQIKTLNSSITIRCR